MARKRNFQSHRTQGNLMQDMENSSKKASEMLDKVYIELRAKRRVPPGRPRTLQERNLAIYRALGHIPQL